MIDIHCHILPGLDDGAADRKTSLEMARMAYADGITDIICTPHHLPGLYSAPPEQIMTAVETLQQDLYDEKIEIYLHPGMEVHISAADVQHLNDGRILSLNQMGRTVLLELHHQFIADQMAGLFWSFCAQGITPVLAHTERYPVLMYSPNPLFEWINMGVMIQITASSLLGQFGREVEQFAWYLLEHNLGHLIASDGHGVASRRPHMQYAAKQVEKRLGVELARDLVVNRPRAVLEGKPLQLPEPRHNNKGATELMRRLKGWLKMD